MRRIIGLVLTVLLLHSIGAQAELLCADSAGEMAEPATGHEGHGLPPADEEAPLPDCCIGMASCAPSWHARTSMTTFAGRYSTPVRNVCIAPRLETTPTPEPPPPKL
jgi:hypothetical protein